MNASLDPMRGYLKAVGKVPLLSPERERSLALEVQRGDLLAKRQMIQANLRLVVSIAKSYQRRGLELEDLAARLAIFRQADSRDSCVRVPGVALGIARRDRHQDVEGRGASGSGEAALVLA